MKSFAEWSRARASLELKAIADASEMQSQEQARSVEEAASEFDELLGALIENIATANRLVAAQDMQNVGRNWIAEQGQAFSTHLDSKLQEISSALSGKVAHVILPFLKDLMVNKAVDDFCAVLRQNITPALRNVVVVQAPAEVQQLLREGMDKAGLRLEIEAADGSEIEADVAGMKIETTLAEWSERLQELVKQ